MKIKLSVPEFLQVCKAIRLRPERIFKMIRSEIREAVGYYLNEMMKAELTEHLGRQPYERRNSDGNHRNGGGNGKLNSYYYGKQNSHGNGKRNSHQDGK